MRREKTYSALDIGYMAGVLDGEGSLSIYRYGTGQFLPRVEVAQKNLEWLKGLQDLWGGTIIYHQRQTEAQALNWTLQILGEDLTRLLTAVMPYLRMKSQQARLCLEMRRRIDRRVGRARPVGAMTTEEYKYREHLYKQCKLLNKRGPIADQLKMNLKETAQGTLFTSQALKEAEKILERS